MHAYLIIATGEKRKAKSEELIKKLKVKPLEFPMAKIEDTRQLNKFTALKIDQPTAIVINDIDTATEEAQNAFLKNLEEPQENLYYLLTARTTAGILPTILSRCQVIKIKNQKSKIKDDGAATFLKLTIGGKLAFCDQIKDRKEAKELVNNLIDFLHKELLSKDNPVNTAKNLEVCLKILNNLEANGNVVLQLSALAINLV